MCACVVLCVCVCARVRVGVRVVCVRVCVCVCVFHMLCVLAYGEYVALPEQSGYNFSISLVH